VEGELLPSSGVKSFYGGYPNASWELKNMLPRRSRRRPEKNKVQNVQKVRHCKSSFFKGELKTGINYILHIFSIPITLDASLKRNQSQWFF
jgi:hypothetical protein